MYPNTYMYSGSSRSEAVAGNSKRYDDFELRTLVYVAMLEREAYEKQSVLSTPPRPQFPHGPEFSLLRDTIYMDKPRAIKPRAPLASGSGIRNPGPTVVQPQTAATDKRPTTPIKVSDDEDAWVGGYITDSGRKVVPVKKFISPSTPRARRNINSPGRSSRRHNPLKIEAGYKCPGCENIFNDVGALKNHLLDVPDCQEDAGDPETWSVSLHEFKLMTYESPRRPSTYLPSNSQSEASHFCD